MTLADPLARFNRRMPNPIVRSFAGRPFSPVAIMVHRGRASGRRYRTPVIDAGSFTTRTAARTLLDAGADLEAPGGIIGNGTPLADAVAFGQWNAARRLVEHGASIDQIRSPR